MFERTKRESTDESTSYTAYKPAEPVVSNEPRTRTREAAVIGPSIQINGDLRGEEDLIIQGKVHGTIQLKDKSLTVGTEGKVDANVLAHAIIVEGQVNGDLFGSERVAIRKTGNVHGNIVSPKVSLEEGCRFKGSIDMDEEAVKKAVGKQAATATSKQDSTPTRPKPVEVSPPAGADTSTSGSTPVKSGSAA